MGRSVEELRIESERSRAALSTTVDLLKERLSDTAEDIRLRASPQHVRSEVGDYFSQKTQSWIGALKQKAMDNPMQAIAAGAVLGAPLLRLARGFPLPLVTIGAGLILSSKTVRGHAVEATAPATDKAEEMLNQAANRAEALHGSLEDTVSSVQSLATEYVHDARDKAGSVAHDLMTRAGQATSTATDKLKLGMDVAKQNLDRAQSAAQEAVGAFAAEAPEKARQLIGSNAALIGGLGLAVGAVVAAALPKNEAETKVMGNASASVKRAAKEATQAEFAAVKDVTMSAADAAANSVKEADLGARASRMTQNIAGTLKEAAEDVVTAALNPAETRTPEKRSS